MAIYKYAPGWNKETVMAQIKKYNNGTRAYNKRKSSCEYQSDNGNRCAIGCFLPEGRHMGCGSAVVGLLDQYPELLTFLPFYDIKALRGFQLAHDDCRQPGDDIHSSIERWLDENMED